MLSSLPTHLRQRVPADSTRHGLVAEMEILSAAMSALEAYRHRVVSAIDALCDEGMDGAGVVRSVGRVSGKVASRISSTAARMVELPSTADALASGSITGEHADVIAEAAARVDPCLADAELLSVAVSSTADLFAKRARVWVAGQESSTGAESRQQRQRADRSVTSWTKPNGMKVWFAQLDPITAAMVASRLDAEYDRLWRADGGREAHRGAADVANPDRRTAQQRMADAFVSLVTGSVGSGSDSAGSSRPQVRQQMISVVDLTRMRSHDPIGRAAVVDGTPLPQGALEHLACISDITGAIFDGPSNPIWVGHTSRAATTAQWKALIARDRGCVGCGADPNRCEAHHIVAWQRGGTTDITNLVLVCSRCHHDIHDRGMSLVRHHDAWVIKSRAGPLSETNVA